MSDLLELLQAYAESIVAAAALLVSVYSIALSRRALAIQQQHNRLSVRPIGKISFRTSANEVVIALRNDGVGPLVACEFLVRRSEGGEPVADLRHEIPAPPAGVRRQVGLSSRFAIVAGSEKVVLRVHAAEGEELPEEYRSSVLAGIARLTLELRYTDIYDQEMPRLERSRWTT